MTHFPGGNKEPWVLCIQSVILGPVASPLSGSSLEMQIPRPLSKPSESEYAL